MREFDGLKLELDLQTKKRIIFSSLFIVQNRMQTLFDNYLGEITSKQWLIMTMVSIFPNPPSLSKVAERAGCSRQNVKKIAVILEKKGFLELVSEKKTREVCIVLKQKFYDFYNSMDERSTKGIEEIFKGVTQKQIDELFKMMNIIDDNIKNFPKGI